MSSIITQSRLFHFLQRASPLAIQKRFSTRESIHRYVEPDKFKKHMLAASEHYYRRKSVSQTDSCFGSNQKAYDLHPLQRIYADELLDAVKKNDFVLFIQHNYTPFQSERVYKNTLIKSGGMIYSHRNEVYKQVFANLGHLFVTRNSLVLGKIDSLPTIAQALKKMPQFLLLAGLIEDEVYSHDQLKLIISASSNLNTCRSTLTSILETPGRELLVQLQSLKESRE